jgi:hypothetical protein
MNMIEGALLHRLLERNFPGRDALVQQIPLADVRWGGTREAPSFMSIRVPEEVERAEVDAASLSDAEGIAWDIDGMKIHLIIHLEGGRLAELEVIREDGEPIRRYPDAESIKPAYPPR